MAAVIESKKKDTVLLGDIQQHAVKNAQRDSDRRQDIIHPSEMAKADWCPRQTAWRIRGEKETDKPEVHGYHMLTVFQEGHDVHTKWQTWLGEMGRLWGYWYCTVCGDAQWGVSVRCNEHGPMTYGEVRLDAEEEWLIAGKADGAVPDIEAFIEVKTIGLGTLRMEEPNLVRRFTVHPSDGPSVVDYDGMWKSLKHPLKSHRKQAAVYLAIARLRGWKYDRMVFIYENKANQQTKEFVVGYDETLAEELIDTAKDVKWSVESGTDLARPAGFKKDRKPCTQCVFRTRCWGEEENDDQDSDTQSDAADGGRVPRSQSQARPAEDRDADAPRRRVPRSARRSDRPDRQRPAASDDTVHEVGRVPRGSTRVRGGGRVVQRRVSRPREGGQESV